jgi:hypothetical protein
VAVDRAPRWIEIDRHFLGQLGGTKDSVVFLSLP